jgi:hypothetical protein
MYLACLLKFTKRTNCLLDLFDSERLREVRIEARIEALLSALFDSVRRDGDDWHLAVWVKLSQLLRTLDTAHDWHV